MDDERLTHASFFSGVGGLDMGLERAGWRTVSFSEIDPYASAVLAQRWPRVPNLGDITSVASPSRTRVEQSPDVEYLASSWEHATLWTGGFPCQDLSVAGKRRGMGAGTRSGLAYAFLDLVGRHRPRFVLLENVPGLLSSHAGRDFGTLLNTLVQLGYGVGYRVLDARHFGVPQRRRRVFILADSLGGRAGAECAAEVLSVGSRCHRHPPTGVEAGEGAADGASDGFDGVGTIAAGLGHHGHAGTSSQAVAAGHVIAEGVSRPVIGSYKRSDEDISTLIPTLTDPTRLRWDAGYAIGPALTAQQERNNHPSDQAYVVGPSSDSDRVRAPDGLAGRSHDRDGVADTLRVGGRASGAGDSYDNTPWVAQAVFGASGMIAADPLLPLGLDSHRYRCCGNGVVSDVAEWIGLRLAAIA